MARTAITVDPTELANYFDIARRTVRHLRSIGVLTAARDRDGKELRGRYELLPNVRA